jgi:hypothetical protein
MKCGVKGGEGGEWSPPFSDAGALPFLWCIPISYTTILFLLLLTMTQT